MSGLTFDEACRVLPDLDELRPVVDRLLSDSEPDPARRWSASGEVDVVGNRLVDAQRARSAADELAAHERDRLARVYGSVLEAVSCLSSGDRDRAALALLQAAAVEEARDDPRRAAAYARAAYGVAERGVGDATAAVALRRWARASRALGDATSAEELYRKAFEIASGVGEVRGAAEAAIGVGNVLEDQGRWDRAEDWYAKALRALEVLPPSPELWHALLNIHVVRRSRGEIDDSTAWLERAEAVADEVADGSAAVFLGNARGQLHMARGEFADAESTFRDALAATPGSRAAVVIRLNLAEALLARGHILDAAEEVREAEREAVRAGLTGKLPEVYRLMGRIASAREAPSAFVLFERALEIVRERGLPAFEEALTLQAYADAEARSGEAEHAEQLAERAREIYEALGIGGERRRWADAFDANERRKTGEEV